MNILPTGRNIGALFLMVAAHIWRHPWRRSRGGRVAHASIPISLLHKAFVDLADAKVAPKEAGYPQMPSANGSRSS